jgi:putative Flp pilus-assembly TadE/G-like protein
MNKERGQILPLFAILLVGILAMMALSIDVTSAYSARQGFRTIADAAALAGAQDLQEGTTRTLSASDYVAARSDAIASVGKQLGVAPTCGTLVGFQINCTVPGSDLTFSVRSPLNSASECVSCDPLRSVFVNFANPRFQLSAARILGMQSFNVAVGSVAGLSMGKSYTIVALRPPRPLGSSTGFDVRDIRLDGGTTVNVDNGDVGSNANMEYGGTDSLLTLDPGFSMYYYDPGPPEWTPPSPANPTGMHITSLIEDPKYVIPSVRTGAPPSGIDSNETTGSVCANAALALLADPGYSAYVPVSASAPDMSKIVCWRPGIYSTTLNVSNGDLAIMEPGLYFLDKGIDARGSLIGGYTAGVPGVALVLPQSSGTGSPVQFNNTTSGGSAPTAVLLNAGTKFGNPIGGAEAAAALDFAGNPIVTNTTPAIKMTLMVTWDSNCIVQVAYPTACDDTHNSVIKLTGGTALYLAGVQYMPSDNVTLSGNSAGQGFVGQIVAWTIFYTGGSTLNQEGTGGLEAGILRLDAACTLPDSPCAP